MKLCVSWYCFVTTCWIVTGCVSVYEDDSANETTVVTESIDAGDTGQDSVANNSEASMSEKSGRCELRESDLEELRISAKAYLLREWPVLEPQCEMISRTVDYSERYGCSILGGPVRRSFCAEPSHFGYAISFDIETLEPTRIGWLTDKRIE